MKLCIKTNGESNKTALDYIFSYTFVKVYRIRLVDE